MCKHSGLTTQASPEPGHTILFSVKIWLEEPATATSPTLWRGHVTNLMSGERRYFQSLVQLDAYIEQFIEQWQPPTLPKSYE